MNLAEVAGSDGVTTSFRVSVLVALIALATFMWRLLAAVKQKAMLEQRVETHLSQTEPMVEEFRLMQRAIASGENRHQAMTERLDRFIEQQDKMNTHFRDTLDYLIRKGGA